MWANHIFEEYIHERFMKTNKITIFHPHWFQFRVSVTRACNHAQGPRQDPPWTGRPPSQGYSHPPTLRQWQVAMPTDLMCTSLGWGRNLESLEKPHTDVGRAYILHIDSGPSQELIPPPPRLINVITKWHWRKQCYWRWCCTVQLHLLRLGSSASYKLSCWFKYRICLCFLILLYGVVL